MSVTLAFGSELPQRPPVEIKPTALRILVMGDLGGAREWHTPSSIDCEDLDAALAAQQVRATLELAPGGPTAEVPLQSLEDFHPDQLIQNLDLFRSLRERRQRLQDPQGFAAELNAIRATPAAPAPVSSTEQAPEPDDAAEQALGASLLDQAIEQAQARQAPLEEQLLSGSFDWDQYVRQLVAPYVVEKADPRQAEMLDHLDETLSDALRQVLHHPRFQQLEASWRGVDFLTRRLETGRELQLGAVNVSRDALLADLLQSDNLTQSQLYRLLLEEPEARQTGPWHLVVADFQFTGAEAEIQALGRIARICAVSGTLFVCGASSQLAGCSGVEIADDPAAWTAISPETQASWESLRKLRESRQLVLALPRILGRRLYGADSSPIEAFSFEECRNQPQHAEYLWMNAAFGIATLYGQAFLQNGWQLNTTHEEELGRLPTHYYEEDGEETMQACAETYLVDRLADKFVEQGLTVVRSVRHGDSVRFEKIRTLSREHPDPRVS